MLGSWQIDRLPVEVLNFQRSLTSAIDAVTVFLITNTVYGCALVLLQW